MNLQSPSGYAMPFELTESEPLEIIKEYGGSENDFNHGIDFKVRPNTWLKALATGIVSGVSSDIQKGFNITIIYRNYQPQSKAAYEVTYYHIKESICNFGQNVKAEDNVAVCDDYLHMEVRFNGKEINPLEFLTMVRDNLVMESQKQMSGNNPEIATLDFDVHTPYDNHEKELDQMYNRFFGSYMKDMLFNRYQVPKATENTLRDIIQEGSRLGAYYEHIPSMLNPLGLGERSFGLIGRIQTLLIQDFLNYLALMQGVFLSAMTEAEKKKLLTGQ